MKPKNNIPDGKNTKAFSILKKAVDRTTTGCLLVGITGAGGAGKTTFAQNVVHYYGNENSVTIDLDDYLLSREERGKLEVTGYNPKANRLYLARDHLESLGVGKEVYKPRYDHSTGKNLSEELVKPKPLIIVEGVTTLYPELRELFQISFFLDAFEETQLKSRINRDVNKRGYSLEEALALFEAIKPDYRRFIAPTKEHASVIFQVDTAYVMHTVHIDDRLR